MGFAEKLGLKKPSLPALSYIPVSKLTPSSLQPRRQFDNEGLESLAHSIKQSGVLQPLCVRPRENLPRVSINGQVVTAEAIYEIIAGERRWRAARLAGLDKVPCIVMNTATGESAKIALAENFYRRDLNFFEQAAAMQNIMLICGLNQTELADTLGVSQSMVANKLRLLKLSEEERRIVMDCGYAERTCRAFLRIEREDARLRLLRSAEANRYSGEECERRVEAYLKGQGAVDTTKKKSTHHKMIGALSDIRFFINSVDKAIGLAAAAGFEVERCDSDLGDYYELRLVIPKVRKRG
ncbi:MAG: ParB/RepB/Spo0J family partition protein [Clostridia bacterium]|nr:ParB/RepB/Spo0J family partition protein [Clostridia bacterium]